MRITPPLPREIGICCGLQVTHPFPSSPVTLSSKKKEKKNLYSVSPSRNKTPSQQCGLQKEPPFPEQKNPHIIISLPLHLDS